MAEAGLEIDRFDHIVHECGKEYLRLQVRVLEYRAVGVHVVVSSTASGAAYQVGRSWPAAFARDLQEGVFG
jgi:hypothetical protein